MHRRKFLSSLGALGLGGMAYASYKFWPDAGFSNPCLAGMPDNLQNYPLMQQIWNGIDPAQVWDSHVHIVGTGDSGSGIWFNPNMDSWLHPVLKIQKQFYENGACADAANIDVSSITRMLNLAKEMPAGYKSLLFAFDWFHNENGKPNKENSIFYIPNAYAAKVASEHSQYFEWVASIHPYRDDAVDALEQAKAQGARAIKWLPPGMGIDPASPKCDAFYKKAVDLNLPIITHTGRESAIQGGNQNHGNPLRLRRALDQGVRVILAHCASDGDDEDLDHGNKRIKSLDLFARLMDTPDYRTLAYGEISAITLMNHAWTIKTILARTDWHDRLVNGTDYPLPAIMPLINTRQLCNLGLLDSEHLPFLQTLKQYNPLMFDFAVKRLIRFNGISFDKKIFETRRIFDDVH
ncbi:MAG: amidohydrolase [Methylophilaceae bacterium]|nr:MAG: amidohydrolase [Methylophilaceae bacterium]